MKTQLAMLMAGALALLGAASPKPTDTVLYQLEPVVTNGAIIALAVTIRFSTA